MPKKKSEKDEAWQRFFDQTDTLQQIKQIGLCYVTASALKQYGEREPRLMAKIDTLAERPEIFRDHNLSIFPTKNGEYVLFEDPTGKTYYRFSEDLQNLPIQEYTSHTNLFAFDSFPNTQRLNESQAIDFAYISSLLQHFTCDEQIHLTIRGRTFSNPFHRLMLDMRVQTVST
jgi:hypothetical protein